MLRLLFANETAQDLYMMKYESMEERIRQWETFAQDMEWNDVKQKSEQNGKIVERVDQFFFLPVIQCSSSRMHESIAS
ncbi:NIPSNAP family protein [Paenibacillus lupini]|uniref:NIPSNAP family protein n=1 Tax=Paenibacillus lupini TaxID=1450204 RepID=UPI0014226006|nr:NIPSNAP family protein [Paenibacillus lupini]NIK22732.1 hypothetical protein [Paenibacillus lupini]